MVNLPLKVQVGIRDTWENKDSPLQKSFANVKEVVGTDVSIRPEWSQLIAELDNFYPDKAAFVPAVAGCVQAWCTSLTALCDNEDNAAWSDKLLEKVNHTIKITLQVASERVPTMAWSDEQKGFIIGLPKGMMPGSLETFFMERLMVCFDEPAESSSSLPHRPTPDDWTDVSVDRSSGKASVKDTPAAISAAMFSQPVYDTLPDFSTVEKPDELLLKPPYHLVVYGGSSTSVEVQCSHSPSLYLLSEYLKRWCRANHNDTRRPPAVEVKLHQICFGLGMNYDRLTMTADNRYAVFSVTPMIVLSFVEGVLGYKSVNVTGTTWVFRKDVELKKYGY